MNLLSLMPSVHGFFASCDLVVDNGHDMLAQIALDHLATDLHL